MFEPYGVVASSRDSEHSIGLGLSVSKRLATVMGGDLTYRHQSGESIFELRLPVWDSAAAGKAV